MKPKAFLRSLLIGASSLAAPALHATDLYWDTDGITAGAGGTSPSGTWASGGTTWSTSPTGSLETSAYTTTSADDLFFSAGTNATGAYTISLTSTQDARSLTFQEGAVTISGASGNITLGGTGDIRVNGSASALIGNNTSTIIAGTAGLTKDGWGTLTLNGSEANTFTGGLRLYGGTLALNYQNLATPTDLVDSGNALSMGGGFLTITGKNSSTTSQTFNGTTIGQGGGSILVNPNAGTSTTLTLGSLTANAAGSSLVVGRAISAGAGTLNIATSSAVDATGIMGGRIIWANGTANTGYDFATKSGSNLTAYTGYTAFASSGTDAGTNYRLQTAAITGVTTQSVNTLKIIGVNLTQNAGTTLTIESGGLLSASAATSIISGGNLTAGNGSGSYDLFVFQGGTGGGQTTITSDIIDNDGNAVNFVKAGPGTTILNSAKSYTGNTYVNAGILDFVNFAPAGSERNVHVAPGALVKFTSPTTALMGRIAQTNEEIGIITTSNSSAAIDFSPTGADLPNAFLAGGWFSNGAKNDNFTGTITPANNTYRIGFTGAAGSFGLSSLLDGAGNGLIVGGNNVILTNANTFGGETQVRTGASLLLANTLAMQNSALNVGTGSDAISGSFALSRFSANVVNDKLVTSATLGGLIGSRNLVNAYGGAYGNNAGFLNTIAVRGFTLNTGADESHVYSGNIVNFARDMTMTKTGAGSQELGGNNTYSGVTAISDGVLRIGHANALGKGGSAGASAGSTIVNSNGTLDLNGVSGVVEPILLNGTGFGGNGALVNNSANAASILGGIASLQITSGGTYTGTAPTVTLTGAGSGATATVQMGLSNASLSSFSGGTGWVVGDLFTTTGGGGSGAVFEVTSVVAGNPTGWNIVNAGTGYTSAPTAISKLGRNGTATGTLTLAFNASNFAVAGLTLTNGGSGYDGTTSASFSTGGATAIVQHSSVVLASDSSIGGSGDISISAMVSEAGGSHALTKVGAGTLTLSATNSYTGATNITGGTLIVDGNISTSVLTTVGLGATLGGSGTVGDLTIAAGGFFTPGNSPGIMTVDGDYIQNGTLVMELNGLPPGIGGHDQVIVNGTVTLNGALSIAFDTFTPMNGDLIFILLNGDADAITGTFTGLAQGAVAANYGGFDWQISYVANSTGDGSFTGGNDIALMAIPEPSAALLAGLGLLALLRRRR